MEAEQNTTVFDRQGCGLRTARASSELVLDKPVLELLYVHGFPECRATGANLLGSVR